jgi:outer membrane cobalamin receptor
VREPEERGVYIILKYLDCVTSPIRASTMPASPAPGRWPAALIFILLAILAAGPVKGQAPAQQQTAQQRSPLQLGPAPVKTSITVTDKVSVETPASVTVFDRPRLQQIPSLEMDDALRMIPGFSLLRRSSSLAANPTTQGVSLRGIASTGASRTLLLWDGIPLNDPFGGWVYWDRIPIDEVDRVEVSRGASTSLFGDRAMAGEIGIFSRQPDRLRARLGYQGGSRHTDQITAGLARAGRRHWAFSTNLRAFRTEGYWIVPGRLRGYVDRPAGVDFVTGLLRVDWFSRHDRVFLKFDVLAEERANGTILQNNSTGLGTLAGSWFHDGGLWSTSATAWHTREQFHASFSSVAANRNAETLSYTQRVPSNEAGAALLFRYNAGVDSEVLGGADITRDGGNSIDTLASGLLRVGGGSLVQSGQFVQGHMPLGPLLVFAGGRHTRTAGGTDFWSPSMGASTGLKKLRLRASAYRSFRAPTLNELYREFRVGNVVTQANAALVPERLAGVEAGVDYIAGERTRIGLTLYRSNLNDLITNVTLDTTPNLIVRQRQNAAAARARGAELDVRHRWVHWDWNASWLLSDARYANDSRIPQSPRNSGTTQLTWTPRVRTMISAGLRSTSAQFDDDLNQFRLPGFATAQLVVRQSLKHGVTASMEIENMLDREYLVGYTPTQTIGGPRLVRVGLRWESKK